MHQIQNVAQAVTIISTVVDPKRGGGGISSRQSPAGLGHALATPPGLLDDVNLRTPTGDED